jgi:hypothetical protein
LGLGLAASSAWAQQPQTQRVRGVIESVDGNDVVVKARDGAELKLKLRDNAVVRAMIPAKLSDIKSGTAVGITSAPQADGSLKAIEVHLLVVAAGQAVNSFHSTWDLAPNTFMTNGPVQTSIESVDGQQLTVQYKTGDKVDEKKIIITPQTSIVGYEPATKGDLKPGEKIFVAGAPKLADGTLDVATISFGKNGMTPPM